MGQSGPVTGTLLPRVASYLERFPSGIDSYPYCQVKGAVVATALSSAGVPLPFESGLAPPCVEALTRKPPAVSDWVPEVHYGALAEAIFELHYAGPTRASAFDEFALDVNRKLFRSPLYKVMFLVVSPERMYIGATRRWASFHRGSLLTIPRHGPRGAHLRLTYPPNLFPAHTLRAFGLSFQAAGEAAGASHVKVTHMLESDGTSDYEIEWTTGP